MFLVERVKDRGHVHRSGSDGGRCRRRRAGGAAPTAGADGGADAAAAVVDPDTEVGAAGTLLVPKILLMIVPEMLIVRSRVEW
jgi:hypothetical protein